MTAPRAVAAALVGAVALGTPLALGGGRLERLLTGHTRQPMVEVGLVGQPAIDWTGIGAATVHLTYEIRLTGSPATTLTVATGRGTDPDAPVTGPSERVDVSEGHVVRRTADIAVSCTTRTKVGVTVTGGPSGRSEVYTWVRPIKDEEGHLACSLT